VSLAKRPKATPEAIVAAARSLARERGWPAVTIRALADRLGYASPILYEHFRNKDEVLAAAARVGFAALEADLGAAGGESGTEARIVALGDAYVAFALREPELYRVMHGLDGAVADPATVAAGAGAVCALVMAELETWARAQGAPLPDPLAATEILWCLAHGIASLALATRTEPGRVEAATHALLRGWRVAPGSSAHPEGPPGV
jgi:AcrR family transcriptional regulator